VKYKKYPLLFLGLGSICIVIASLSNSNKPNTINLQAKTQSHSAEKPVKANSSRIINHEIQAGENLSTIFSSLNLNKADLSQIINTNDDAKQFANISAGKFLQLKTNPSGLLEQLSYKINAIDTLSATRSNNGFIVELTSKAVTRELTSVQSTIESSLFLDGQKAGLSNKLILQLANIFAWDIDFATNLQSGDQFTVVYEKIIADGKEVDTSKILSAEFVNRGKIYSAVKYKDPSGNINYYTPDGNGMRKAFLSTPVDFAHISSHYNLKRKHPILNRIRAHTGVDYAARTGTPIKSTGDGKIAFHGNKGGYGQVVIIKHGDHYETLYAHMSSFRKDLKNGASVKQGDIIGYVGQSGLATGPHLHYEFRIDGTHRNPLALNLPHSLPINKKLLANFKAQTKPLLAQLNQAKAQTLFAKN